MKFFKEKLPRKVKWQIAGVCAAIIVAIVLVVLDVIYDGPLTKLLTNRDRVVEIIKGYGFWGPLAFIVLQAAQTVLAPIPGQVMGIVGGFIFGWWGLLWTLIGTTIGFYIVFVLARKLGRPFIEKIVNKKTLDKFDFLTDKSGELVFFIIFLIPGLPDDVVCYLAGMTKIPIPRLLLLVTIGRLPATIMNNLIGTGLGGDDIHLLVIGALLMIVLFAILYFKKDAVMKYIKEQSKDDGKSIEKLEEKVLKVSDNLKETRVKAKTKIKGRVEKIKETHVGQKATKKLKKRK
jgi:uncharacterized membrane protein YdjX (TVP38/TMEM64 family)